MNSSTRTATVVVALGPALAGCKRNKPCFTIVTNTVFSPQYLLWLIAPLVGPSVLDPQTWHPYVPWGVVKASLIAAVFPGLFVHVLGQGWIGLLVLTARDLVVLGLAIAVARQVVRAARDHVLGTTASAAMVELLSSVQPCTETVSPLARHATRRLRTTSTAGQT